MEHVIYRFLVGIWNPVSKKRKLLQTCFSMEENAKEIDFRSVNLPKLKMLLQRLIMLD